MKKVLLFILFFIFLVQFSFFPFVLGGTGMRINFIFAFILVCSLVFSFDILILLSIAGGLLLDYFSIYAVGTQLIPVVVTAVLFWSISEKIISDKMNYFLVFLVFISAKLSYGILMFTVSQFYGMLGVKNIIMQDLSFNRASFWFGNFVFSIVGIVIYWMVSKMHNKFIRDRIEIVMK